MAKMKEIPAVDWLDLENNRGKFFEDLRYALAECGFLVLTNAPGLDDDFQQRYFREVRGFFDAPRDVKKTAHIANSPYFRGWTPQGGAIEAFQYGIEAESKCAHDDTSQPIFERVYRGPNVWPKTTTLPGFKPAVDDYNSACLRLTHELGELIIESLGEDPAEFRQYFDLNDPYLCASLSHNFSLDVFAEDEQKKVREKYDNTNAGGHLDLTFITLLTYDRPGLQVVAGEGDWIDAPVTCRTAEGDYDVIPGSVVVNAGAVLMHLSEGRYSATMHRVNPTLVPMGETRISMPYFLQADVAGDLVPFGKSEPPDVSATGYKAGDGWATHIATERLTVFPSCSKRWWKDEFKKLTPFTEQLKAETDAAYELAAERGERYKQKSSSL